jgi:dCTP deaminase
MGLKPDTWIRKMATEKGMITPFVDAQKRDGIISYGLSSYGYDIRVADEFKVFAAMGGRHGVVDPKALDTELLRDFRGDVCIIPPNSFALARSLERMKIPRNVLATVLGKSTYARVGTVTNFTPLEPEWEGFITIEISNTTPLPVKIYANEGIAQVLFFEGDEPCKISYADKKGKYQGQVGVTLPRL